MLLLINILYIVAHIFPLIKCIPLQVHKLSYFYLWINRSVSGISNLFSWPVCVFLHHHHTVLIILTYNEMYCYLACSTSLFLYFNIIWTIQYLDIYGLLHFHISFRISLAIFHKKMWPHYDWNCFGSINNLGEIVIFNLVFYFMNIVHASLISIF